MTHNEIMIEAAADMFDSIQCFLRTNPCAIAGGFVRDLLLDKEIRDIDFYLTKKPMTFFDSCLKTWLEKNPHFELTGDSEYVYPGSKILNVYRSTKGVPRELIILDNITPQDYVNNYFDVGICQALVKSSGDVFTSEVFDSDRKFHEITSRGDRLVKTKHIDKLMEKFPYYKVQSHIFSDPTRWFLKELKE